MYTEVVVGYDNTQFNAIEQKTFFAVTLAAAGLQGK